MKSGFSQVRLDESLSFPMGGMFLQYSCTEVHTPLYASAWALQANGLSLIWISCDLICLDEPSVAAIREQIAAAVPVPASQILISATHTHTGPTTCNTSVFSEIKDRTYLETILCRIVQAGIASWADLAESSMAAAQTQVPKCCFNRRYLMKNGQSQMHPGGPDNPDRLIKEGPEDDTLSLLWFEKDGKPAGVIVNFGTHASVLYGLHIISADFPGVLRRVVQRIYGDIPVLFLQGCCGNTSPVDHAHDPSWGRGMESSERVGTILGGEVVKQMAMHRATKTEFSSVSFASKKVSLPYQPLTAQQSVATRSWIGKFHAGKKSIEVINGNVTDVADWALAAKSLLLEEKLRRAPSYSAELCALRLDDLLFLTNPAELFVEFQLSLREKFPAAVLFSASITNGWCCYVPTRHAHLCRGYEVEQCWFNWNAGQMIEDGLLALTDELK